MTTRKKPRLMDTDPVSRIRPPVQIDDRVTIRYRTDDGAATDVVGWITRRSAAEIEVLSPVDRVTVIDRKRIILAKRVPPALGGRAPERWTAEELQSAAAMGWIADHEPLGSWLLRSGNGFSGRANSCLAVGDPGMSYDQAAAMIIGYYTDRGLEPRAMVVAGSDTERALRGRGWTETYVATTVMAQPLTGLLGDHRRNPRVRISEELTADWWQAYLEYRPVGDHQIARRILSGPRPVGLAAILAEDVIISLGRGQVSSEWLGLGCLWTRPEHRRHGLATMIMIELGHWAARLGARNAYLQVDRENAGAIAAYRKLGFRPHHDYLYLKPGR